MATAVQVVLLWTWHAPPMQRLAMESAVAPALMHGSLLLVAVLFWALLLRVAAAARWHGIAALLVTGKLACLLGGLLIFAPRLLHAGAAHGANHGAALPTSELADQHLAGLLMITACPLSYVAAGVVLAAQMMAELERKAVPPAAIVR
jgi:putative membrane protein